jgi:branched-chain amino acid aminotransferase
MIETASVNGKITALAEATVPVLDRGFQYGDSVYEVTRTYGGVPFLLDEHFERLENSARLSKIKLSRTRSESLEEIKRAVTAAKPLAGEDVFVRFIVSRGVGALDLDPATAGPNTFVVIVKPIPPWKKDFYDKGMILFIPTIRRNSPRTLDPNIKCGNYLNNILAVAEAKEQGADDALCLSVDDKLTEASNSNVLFVSGSKVLTPLHEPETDTGNLRGITRTLLQSLCKEAGIVYEERPLRERDLEKMDECFVTSATREIMPVREIRSSSGPRHRFTEGGGATTKKLQELYGQYIEKYKSSHNAEAWF